MLRPMEPAYALAGDPLLAERRAMVRALAGSVRNRRVLAALRLVPREAFVPAELATRAYEDGPLPIGAGQTVSQPLIVAMMCEALALRGHERVLEVGTGSGYQAAVLSLLAAQVVTVERVPQLYTAARRRLDALGYRNVTVYPAGVELGRAADGPYDGIVVAAAGPVVPQGLVDQLAPGGRLVIPVGSRDQQELLVVTRDREGLQRRSLGGCRFVPLIGVEAWPAPEEDEPRTPGS